MFTFQELKDLFKIAKAPQKAKFSKHQASKKNYQHVKKLSLGEKNHKIFMKHGF